MLSELSRSQYDLVRPIFGNLAYNVEILSILDSNTLGRVFVDDVNDPHVAFIWDGLAGLFLAGRPSAEPTAVTTFYTDFRTLVDGELMPVVRHYGIDVLTFAYDPPVWAEEIPVALPSHRFAEGDRLYHTHNHRTQVAPPMRGGYELLRVDEAMLTRDDLANLDWLRGWITSYWPAIGDFLAKGIGYVVLEHDATVASLCISVFVSGELCEFGTATQDDYRNRGFSTSCTAACVNEALGQGREPVWHCWANNHASVAVARKTGFVLQKRYQVFRFYTE